MIKVERSFDIYKDKLSIKCQEEVMFYLMVTWFLSLIQGCLFYPLGIVIKQHYNEHSQEMSIQWLISYFLTHSFWKVYENVGYSVWKQTRTE